jgi:DNA-binding IclR family transcriptional regulator
MMTTSDRLLSILGLFTVEHPEWTVEQAAGTLGLAVSTAYRYFRSLSKAGLIVAFTAGRYVLGPAIIQYDRQIRLRDPLTTTAQTTMKQLTEQMPAQAVVLLCRLFRNQVICVHQESARKPDFAFSYERGRAMPLFKGAASKVILANMPLRTVKSLHAEHGSKFAQAALGKNWEETKERLRALRNIGYTATQGELDPGMCGIAVPMFDPGGAIVGSLSIVIPVQHLTPKFLSETPQLLMDSAKQIHWALSLGSPPGTADKPLSSRSASANGAKRTNGRAAVDARSPRKTARRVRV